MKTVIIAFLLASCVVSLAQTIASLPDNVTNADLLKPFTVTNSAGIVFTDAVLVKLMPNKFIYRTSNGSSGMLRLDSLSPVLQEKFGYNMTNAMAADVADKQKKDRQEQQWKQKTEQAAMAYALAEKIKNVEATRTVIWAKVMQRVDDTNLLIDADSVVRDYEAVNDLHRIWVDGDHWSVEALPPVENDRWHNTSNVAQGTVLLSDYANTKTTFEGRKFAIIVFPIGAYTYTTVLGASKIIPHYTADLGVAVKFASNQQAE